jgi:thiol-disulfide isomerase/thioredoxin
VLFLVIAHGAIAAEPDKPTQPDAPPAADDGPRDGTLVVRLIRDSTVQSELRLNPAQVKTVDALVNEVEYPLFLIRDLRDEKRREPANKIADQVDATLLKVLTPVQRSRLAQIIFQAQGLSALAAPDRAAALKITESQRGELAKAIAELQNAEAGQLAHHRKQILGILTSTQNADLARLVGKEFDVAGIRQIACRAPELQDVSQWINSPPVRVESLKGQVVALHFWAFGCINCVRNLPHYQSWHEAYGDNGLTVLGLHTPETEQERVAENLERAVKERKIAYPVAFDANAANWKAWANDWWPSVYLIDKQGNVRYWWYGELNWQGAKGEEIMRKRIDELLAEKE